MTLSGRDFIRYSRHLLLADVGEDGQEKLLASRVLIVGMGGLGCPVALYLAGAGVGRLVLCDPDQVELSNLQRQMLYRESDLGKLKAECAREALLALNSGVDVRAWPQAVSEELWRDGGYDLVLDCTDSLPARHWLNRQCRELGTPLVSAAAIGWEGQFACFDFRVRRSPCLACALPEDLPPPVETCANSGVIGPVLGTMGSMQAAAAIGALLGRALDHGKMQRYDARSGAWLSLRIATRAGCEVCG